MEEDTRKDVKIVLLIFAYSSIAGLFGIGLATVYLLIFAEVLGLQIFLSYIGTAVFMLLIYEAFLKQRLEEITSKKEVELEVVNIT